jgi:Rap guanine nucleotide exchange factor 1
MDLINFSHELIANRQIKWAKLLRKLSYAKVSIFKATKLSQPEILAVINRPFAIQNCGLLNFDSQDLAQQMTLLDMELFQKIEIAEMFSYARNQRDDHSPNLAIFVQHFNRMSAWVRTQIIRQSKDKYREKYMKKFIWIMRSLMEYSNFNSYLSLLAALQSPEVSRIPCLKPLQTTLDELGKVFDSSRSFAAYRQALQAAEPPCIPYIGLILQDLTFCHVGNRDLLNDNSSINFTKRWIQYNIVLNMKRFRNE